jgi:transposase
VKQEAQMDRLTEVFCLMDDFCQAFEPEWEKHLLANGHKKRQRPASLCLSELMTLAVLFHQLRFRQFKSFYLLYAQRYLRAEFPGLPSYQRCLELLPRCVIPLSALFDVVKGACTGITLLDSSPIAVCDNLRIARHRVFAGIAARGKSSTGWFFGFKWHIAINHRGELLSMKVTPGNVDDRKPVAFLCRKMFGRVYADKGYIAQWLVERLRQQQVAFITKVRKNMKPVQHTPFDQALLRRRSLIETVFDELKNLCQVEHTRHRSHNNFMVNLMAGIIAYCLAPNKPRMPLTSSAPACC